MKTDEEIEAERAQLEPVIGPTRAGWYAEACRVEHGDPALLWACRYREMAPALYHAAGRVANLVAAAEQFLRHACRPGGDGKYDDLFDDARNELRAIIATTKATT